MFSFESLESCQEYQGHQFGHFQLHQASMHRDRQEGHQESHSLKRREVVMDLLVFYWVYTMLYMICMCM